VAQKFRDSDEQFKQAQKRNFDKRHRTINLPEFENDDSVFVVTRPGTNPSPGTIVQSTNTGRMKYKPPLELLEGTDVIYTLDLKNPLQLQ